MSIIKSITDYFKKNPNLNKEETPEGICPNCWGEQEYGGKFYEAVRNYHNDINSHDPHDGWVKEYADKYLLNIQLQQENDELVCQTCKVSYRLSKD